MPVELAEVAGSATGAGAPATTRAEVLSVVELAEAAGSATGAGVPATTRAEVLSVVGLAEAIGARVVTSDSKQRSVKTCGID